MRNKFIHLSYLLIYVLQYCLGKYVEGELNTSENWAFIARFCFLSQQGQFDFYIEYNEEQGEPNLLLYYDEDDQWNAVYKTSKTCIGKEANLKVSKNQIVNLTTRYPYQKASGCNATPNYTTVRPKYTVIIPTLTPRKYVTTTKPIVPTKPNSNTHEPDYSVTADKEIPRTVTLQDDTNFNLSTHNEDSELLTTAMLPTTNKPIIKRSIPQKAIYQPRGNRNVICQKSKNFLSARARWWFIAISNCHGGKGIHIRYKMLMTNGPPGDYWHEHFSADEFYVLPVLMAFSIAYSFLILAIVICSIELKSRQLLHSTYKLFVFSATVQFFGIMFKSLAYLKYAVNGIGSRKLKLFGDMFMGMSETCFLLLLLLLAKGYTVTRGRLPLAAGVKLTIFMCLYSVTYISLFIYEAKVFDPGEVLYTYESPAGYGLIILRILAWCMFIYSTVFTLKHYPEKANFYYPFNVFGTLWFIAGPAFIISANTYIDNWVRESVVCAVLLFITFGGHLMFLLLTMPSVANKNFPYHVRTTQIGIMEVTGHAGNSSIEQFGHHTYEPSNAEPTTIIPLSRRTEEIFGGLYSHHMHTSIPSNRRSLNGDMDGHTLRNGTDIIMENVLSWSLAKNFSALDVAQFDKVIHSNAGSANSRRTENREPLSLKDDVEPPVNPNDWVRDVPVELFTISKMIVTKQTPKPADDSD